MRVAPALAIKFVALFNPGARGVKEVLYQSAQAFVVDHAKYTRAFGGTTTTHEEAIAQTLEWFRQQTEGVRP